MAIVLNTSSEIGDVLVIKASVPILGLVTLSSFTDSVGGETANKYFSKQFRYSLDGINFSTWLALTNPNITGIDVTPTSNFMIEYRYIRTGTDASGTLSFTNVEVDGTFTSITCGQAYSNSIFGKFFSCTDLCVLSWMINVLEKLYKEGVLSKYIERGEQNNDQSQDLDFVEFWKTICQYFAYIVCYARQFEISKMTANYDMLMSYLKLQTFLFCGEESIQDLLYIANNSLDEIRHRGTLEIVKSKAIDGRDVDGELLRLICFKYYQGLDFYFSKVFNYKQGWVLDNSSPLYSGNYYDWNLNKGYESSEDIVSLAKYPLIEPTYVSIITDTTKDVMSVDSVPIGLRSGVYETGSSKIIDINPKWSYEITFQVRQVDIEDTFSFGLFGFNQSKNLISAPFEGVFSGTSTNHFFEFERLNRNDKYYFVRGILFGSEHVLLPGETVNDYELEIFRGSSTSEHLKIIDNNTHYIALRIYINNTLGVSPSGEVRLWDIKVRPLDSIPTGFIQSCNLIKIKGTNDNAHYTNHEVEDLIRNYLIPYNTTFYFDFDNPIESTNVSNVIDVILTTDVRITTPSTNNVSIGDRYLVIDPLTFTMILKQYTALNTWSSTDNSQGNVTYVNSKKNTYIYDTGNWYFSKK